ncbi:MAG: single-stranded-DNA-specific exonuclease RecJ [Alphaproteobacteria bacterium]|nr:single-stranded-DNA-specific exonuclease RecJ [Alphaproteobacteria bacterium]
MFASAPSLETRAAFGAAPSFSGRRWLLKQADEERTRALARANDLPLVLAGLLVARGMTAEDLNPTIKRLLPEPFLFKDMEKAVARAKLAVERGEAIAIFGDYDVDGSCSAALLHDVFAGLGVPTRIYIPDRMTEGYGPSAKALLALKDDGASLVITVDCGAGAHDALAAARDAGLDVIVLDHHAVHVPPPALAHVNPNQPGDTSGQGHIAAVGVTFLFAVALVRALRGARAVPDLMEVLDLVALATVCDVVPLTGVNRAFVRAGLAQLGSLKRPGLAALAGVAKSSSPFTAYHCGYVFGPRINAGGRVGRSSLGVDLLTTRDAALAGEFALALDVHNQERQAIEKAILDEAVAFAATKVNQPYLFAAKDGWHAGVVGIVAGRLKDRFGKPSFVAGFEGGMGRGSARSVPGLDIGQVVRDAKDAGVVESGGGHAMAAGFSLMAEQRDAFEAFLARRFESGGPAGALDLEIDALVSPAGATETLVRDIAHAGPFGAGNPEPVFAFPDVRVVHADVVGRDHVKLRLEGGLDAIAFRTADTALGKALLASRGRTIHAAGRLRTDEWNGRVRVQLHLEDAAPAGA